MGPVIVGIYGPDKSCKSTFALSFPKPIFHMETDIGGFERAAWRYKEEISSGLIVSQRYVIPAQVMRDKLVGGLKLRRSNRLVGYKELWDRLLDDYFGVLDGSKVAGNGQPFQTIIMDSFSEVWELITRTYLQELQELDPNKNRTQLLQIEYATPNSWIKALLYGPKEVGKNLVLTHYMADKYGPVLVNGEVKQEVVGQTHAGWKQIEKVVDVMVETSVKREKGGMVPYGEVTLCGLALELTGLKYIEPTWDQIVDTLRAYRGEG